MTTGPTQLDVLMSGGFGAAYEQLLPDFERDTGIKVATGSGASQGTGPHTIAAQLALGLQLRDAVILAKVYVTKAIEKSYPVGKGAGPLNQLFRFHQEAPTRGVHEVPQHGMHPAAEPAAH